MAFKLSYRAVCEFCETDIHVKARNHVHANDQITQAGWLVSYKASMLDCKHYCPEHAQDKLGQRHKE